MTWNIIPSSPHTVWLCRICSWVPVHDLGDSQWATKGILPAPSLPVSLHHTHTHTHTQSLSTHTQTCTLYGKLTWLDAVSLVMHVECWWGSLGAFFKKKKRKKREEKKGEAVESFLCACKTERKERRGRGRERGWGRENRPPHIIH